MAKPIVDAHVHLFPAAALPTLSWFTPSHPLASQHYIDEYQNATAAYRSRSLRGFVFIETDRISAVSDNGSGDSWSHAMNEISMVADLILHSHSAMHPCLGFVAWAPIPGGPVLLEKYLALVKQQTDDLVYRKLCGFRYLLQDKQYGTMSQSGFVEGMKWLGTKGFTFDLTVDARSGGLSQLREALDMMEMVYRDTEVSQQTTIVLGQYSCGFSDRSLPTKAQSLIHSCLDHLCKPNLRLDDTDEKIHAAPEFTEWKDLICAMARYPKTYMKLSGCFSELHPLSGAREPDYCSLIKTLEPWTDVIFEAFGPGRVMFASDWPVCNIGAGGNEVGWHRWSVVVELLLEKKGFTQNEKNGIWGQVAIEAYGLLD